MRKREGGSIPLLRPVFIVLGFHLFDSDGDSVSGPGDVLLLHLALGLVLYVAHDSVYDQADGGEDSGEQEEEDERDDVGPGHFQQRSWRSVCSEGESW